MKLVLSLMVAVALSLHHCDALKCYYCEEACESSKAKEISCGANIGSSHEAMCTTQRIKESKNPERAERRCQVVTLGQKPSCPSSDVCTECKGDLCNAAPSVGAAGGMVGIVATCLAARFLLG